MIFANRLPPAGFWRREGVRSVSGAEVSRTTSQSHQNASGGSIFTLMAIITTVIQQNLDLKKGEDWDVSDG